MSVEPNASHSANATNVAKTPVPNSFQDKKQTGIVFNVQKYSVHDGPGIRTIVFLKGCSLSCYWCSNPESQRLEPDLAYNVGRCLTDSTCSHCFNVCPNDALSRLSNNAIHVDREKCTGCAMPCADVCPSQGFLVYGKERTVDDVLKTVEQDMLFYSRSGGGLTLSGGEPLFQKDFALALLREAKRRRIKTAIETCGMVVWDVMKAASEHINYFLFDIKHMDSAKHKAFTDKGNSIILDNFKKLAEHCPDKEILCRTPVVPGFNNTVEDLVAICEFIKPFKNVKYEALPYHRLGTQKYTFIGRDVPMGEVQLDQSIMPKIHTAMREILGEERVIIAGD